MTQRTRKNIIILSVTLLLAIVVVVVLLTRNNSTLDQEFNVEDAQNITRIYMEDRDNHHVDLVKQDSAVWIVDGQWKASYEAIRTSLLNTLEEMRVREPVARAAHPQVIRNLSSRSVKVDIYEKKYRVHIGNFIKWFPYEALSKSIYVGSETPDNMGTYMLLKGSKEPCVVHIPSFKGFLTTRFNTNPNIWRSHEIISYRPMAIGSIRIEIPQKPDESFELVRNGKSFDFRLLSTNRLLPQFDTGKVVSLISSFASLNYEDIANKIDQIQRDTIFSHPPSFDIRVTDTAGNSTRLRTYIRLAEPETGVLPTDKDDFYEIFDVNRTYGVVDGIKDTLVLQYYVLDNILKPASYYFIHKQ